MRSPRLQRAASLRRFLLSRRADWHALEKSERELRGGGLALAQADSITGGYRRLSRDVAAARAGQPGTRLALQLEALYRRVHASLHAPYEPWRARYVRLLRVEVPASARRLLPALRAVGVIFGLAAGAGALAVGTFPELAALFASEDMISGVQQGRLWTEGLFNVAPSSVLAAGIAANNIAVTLAAYVLGVFYGLGTLYIIGLNGLMLGGLFALTAQFGLLPALVQFVLPHGLAELSIIGIAGAAGLRLGEALARPGVHGRAGAFQAAVVDTGALFAVCLPFLVACAVIEGYVSPDPSFPWWSRATIGVAVTALLWAALFGKLHPPARAQE